MSWNGNRATVVYDDGSEVKSFAVEAAFGDLGVRFLQAVPAELGAMPFRLCVRTCATKRPGTVVFTDVTDIQALGAHLATMADRILGWVREGGETLVELRNGSGTKRMVITEIRIERADVTPGETDDPASAGGRAAFTDEAGLRAEF